MPDYNLEFTGNGAYVVATPEPTPATGPKSRARIVEPRTGEILFELMPGGPKSTESFEFVSAHKSDSIMTFSSDHKGNGVTLWRRTRVPGRFGYLLMAEFWLTIIFGAALPWSLWRDRRIGAVRAGVGVKAVAGVVG